MIEFLEAAIRIATPLMLAALGGILSERAGVFAVGLEGMRAGAASAASASPAIRRAIRASATTSSTARSPTRSPPRKRPGLQSKS